MQVTMTMKEYSELKKKAENYDTLIAAAKIIMNNGTKAMNHTIKTDCYNYIYWASEDNIEAIQQQFETINKDA